MSWNGSDHILMCLYPSGNKEGDAVIVCLTKHNSYDRKAMTVHISIAEIHSMDDFELNQQETDYQATYMLTMEEDEIASVADWSRGLSSDDTLTNIITGTNYRSFWDNLTEAGTAEEESHLREMDYMVAMN